MVSGWWTKGAIIMSKFLPKIRQNNSVAYTRIGNGTESTFAYDRQRERLQSMLLMSNEDSIMQTQK